MRGQPPNPTHAERVKFSKSVLKEKSMAKVKAKAKKAEAVKNTPTQRIELWVYDEYGQGAIVESSTDVAKLFSRAEQYVTGLNLDNALAGGEQEKTWEAHFPVFIKKGKVDTSRIYAGNKRDGKHYVYQQVDGKWVQSELKPTEDVRFFLGNVKKGDKVNRWYLADHRGNEIKSFSDNLLDRKTVLFLKFV